MFTLCLTEKRLPAERSDFDHGHERRVVDVEAMLGEGGDPVEPEVADPARPGRDPVLRVRLRVRLQALRAPEELPADWTPGEWSISLGEIPVKIQAFPQN